MRHLISLVRSLEKPLFINHKFDCNARCLVYLLTCRKCKIQYVGQTVDQFGSRWNNYKSDSRKYSRGGSCMQQHMFYHFCTSGDAGFLDDVSITFIDKTDPSNQLKREDYWRCTLKPCTFWAKYRRKCLMYFVLTCINFGLYWILMAYMSARTS